MCLKASFYGSPQNFRAMTLQDGVESIDILKPLLRPAVHNLGEIANRRLPQFQQLLPFQIAAAAFPRYCCHQCGTMLHQGRAFVAPRISWGAPLHNDRLRCVTRCPYKYNVAGILIASGGIE